MSLYIGIDLGTSNSTISIFDGKQVKILRSPSGAETTPSAIHVWRNATHFGERAKQALLNNPSFGAIRFKKLMGTKTPITIGDKEWRPEECSAEFLKFLMGYLNSEERAEVAGTVITIPAAFNQMQRDATLAAAEMAGLGPVALMQEPVAAVMSVLKDNPGNGMFLIYDLGGGTFDIALAENLDGHVSLLAHGGIPICGGSDMDKTIFENIVKPWVKSNFKLPEGWVTNSKYRDLARLALYYSEEAKISLSVRSISQISNMGADLKAQDSEGEPISLDIPVSRDAYTKLITPQIQQTIEATRNILKENGLTPEDITRIVFVGGPTKYEPLRQIVCQELAIAGDTSIDPMTAVSVGAALFAESVEWKNNNGGRKSNTERLVTKGVNLQLDYQSRTPGLEGKVKVSSPEDLKSFKIQFNDKTSGWESGWLAFKNGLTIALPLTKQGENEFGLVVKDAEGKQIKVTPSEVTITRTVASVENIPASHSISIQVEESIGSSRQKLVKLVDKGAPLPVRGEKRFRSKTAIREGGEGKLVFQLWEGEIQDPIEDNEFVGVVEISGKDIEGVIPPNTEVICRYEVADSGKISFAVTLPDQAITQREDFYSRDGGINFNNAQDFVANAASELEDTVSGLQGKIKDESLENLREKMEAISQTASESTDAEELRRQHEEILETKRQLAKIREQNLIPIQQAELEHLEGLFGEISNAAPIGDKEQFNRALLTAKHKLEKGESAAAQLESMTDIIRHVLMKQDWFIVDSFNHWIEKPDSTFIDPDRVKQLAAQGKQAIARDDIGDLRRVFSEIISLSKVGGQDNFFKTANANIVEARL